MDDEAIRRAMQRAELASPPPFAAVVARPAPRRLRRVRLGLAALVLIAGASAPFVLRRPEPPPAEIALATAPTTDWLLATPDPRWVETLDRHSKPEPSHAP